MPYCTLTDIENHIPEETVIQLTDDANIGTVNQNNVDAAISEADGLIDCYLRGRYELPLSTVPGLVKTISRDLAVYNLYARRMDIEMSDPVKDRYKNSLKILENIQSGKISLGVDSGSAESGAVIKTNKTADDRLFPKSVLDSF